MHPSVRSSSLHRERERERERERRAPCCRLLMEQSSACLCPSVAYQLAGAKKVQQDLAQGAVLRRFARSDQDVQLLQECFAGTAPRPGLCSETC